MLKKDKEKIEPKKKNKIFIIIIIAIILAVIAGIGVFCYLYITRDDNISNTAYIGIFEDGTYYIARAEPNIQFEIDSDDSNAYKLTDSNNETVESSIVQKDGKNYIKAKKKYTEGETYYLELDTANFTDDALKGTKKLEFKIRQDEKAEYELSDNVITIDSENIQLEDDGKLKIQNTDLEEGQIILVENDKKINNAYKISSIEDNLATVVEPEVYEIYDNVDLYDEGKVNFEDLQINENAEIEIEKSIEKSALYKFLVNEVYAATPETPKVTFKIDGEKMTIEIKLTFKADGEEKLGLDSLKDHDLSITFSYITSIDYMADVEKNFSMDYDMAVTTTSELKIELESGNEYLKGISNISDEEYSKSVQEIIQKLQNEVPDVSENSIDIGAIEIPTSIPGIYVYFDIYFQTQLSLQINLSFDGKIETVQHVGFVMNKNESKAYRNASQTAGSWNISVVGKAEIKVGIGLDCGISIINKDLAHAEIGMEVGAYNEYFTTTSFTSSTENTGDGLEIYGKIELGVYLKVKVECSVDVLFYKAVFKADLAEVKQPYLKLETGVKWLDDEESEETTSTKSAEPSSNTTNSSNSTNKTTTGTENGVVGSLSIDTDSEEIKAYKEYILNEKYVSDYEEYLKEMYVSEIINVGYCIFDINQDGIYDLVIDAQIEDDSWKVDAIYTYNKSTKSVTKVELVYNYGGIEYDEKEKEIVYTQTKPTSYTGYSEFYKLSNYKLVFSKGVSYDFEIGGTTTAADTDGKYTLTDTNGKKTNITKEQEETYFEDVIKFSYQDITNVK